VPRADNLGRGSDARPAPFSGRSAGSLFSLFFPEFTASVIASAAEILGRGRSGKGKNSERLAVFRCSQPKEQRQSWKNIALLSKYSLSLAELT
jgi:hypothetical protein